MFCIKCGQQLPNDARFCSQCGTAIVNHPQSSIDLVAAKAEDISVADEIVVSNIHVLNDEVAQKAEMLGIPTEIVSEPTPVKVKKTVARKRYEYQRKNLDIPDLWVIRRIDKDTGSITASCVEYQGKKSDWLERLWYDEESFAKFPIFHFSHKGWSGLLQIDLTCFYWDEIRGRSLSYTGYKINIHGYLFVRKGDLWAIITIKDRKITQLTPYEFDDITVLEKDDALIMRRNALYGYMVFSRSVLYATIPCVLTSANPFSYVDKELDIAAKVCYKGEDLMLKRSDMNLYRNHSNFFKALGAYALLLCVPYFLVWSQRDDDSLFMDIVFWILFGFTAFVGLHLFGIPDWRMEHQIKERKPKEYQ